MKPPVKMGRFRRCFWDSWITDETQMKLARDRTYQLFMDDFPQSGLPSLRSYEPRKSPQNLLAMCVASLCLSEEI